MKEPQATILNNANQAGRADFNKPDFDLLISEKGRTVQLETALRCPCKGKSEAHLTSCKNCGGTGWIFVNPKDTRIVMQGIEVATKLEGWSEENRGMVRITALSEDRLCFMDRLTIMDEGVSIFTETVAFKKKGSVIFAYTAYGMVDIDYIGMFVDVDHPLTRLVYTTDYTIEGNILKLNETKYAASDVELLSVTLRYTHYPTFHIIEMKRDTIQSFKSVGGVEEKQQLPISAYARRAHYTLDAPNLNGDRLLNNNYVE